jgi:hypothetical protein
MGSENMPLLIMGHTPEDIALRVTSGSPSRIVENFLAL